MGKMKMAMEQLAKSKQPTETTQQAEMSIGTLRCISRFDRYAEVRDLLPLDGALALPAVAAELGLELIRIGKVVSSPFGTKEIPFSLTTKTFYNGDNVVIPWGRYAVKKDGKLLGGIETATDQNDGISCFSLWGSLGDDDIWEALIAKLNAHTGTLYKGKAFRMKFGMFGSVAEPEEIRTRQKAKMFFLPEVQEMLETTLFLPIEEARACRELGIPLRRNILLEGGYGTGKTLTAAETARIAVENGWTYILLPHAGALAVAMKMAQKLAPAVLFVEDIDAVMGKERDGGVNNILNTLDGIESKDKEVMLVYTTNFAESLDPAFLRPGRLDSIITLLPLDRTRVMEMIEHFTGMLCPEVAILLEGASPAIVKETIDRAKLFAHKRKTALTEQLLITCAKQMNRQRDAMMPRKKTLTTGDELAAALGNVIVEKLQHVGML